jgi:hypothetical protein
MSHMHINRKTCDIRTWKKTFISRHILHQHWYICPTNSPVRRNPQHRSFWLLSQPLPHLRSNLFLISEKSDTFLDPVVNHFTWQTLPTVNRKRFFMNTLCIESFCPQKKTHNRNCSSVVYSSTVAILTTETRFWTCVCASDRLQWSWTVLLPSDIHRAHAAVLLPFLTYLLTLPRRYVYKSF